MSDLKFIISEDGSHTLFDPKLDETYHSTHGAVQESKHVFIDSGLSHFIETNKNTTPNILEVGLGTGLNVLLTVLYAEKHNIKIELTSLEKYPLSLEITDQLNYHELLGNDAKSILTKIHSCEWNKKNQITDLLTFTKIDKGLNEYQNKIHNLVFYDAFAPSKQPEMWEIDSLTQISNNCLKDSTFVTYCAKGQVRRDLQSLGFTMERIPGPPGKFQMLRGTLIS